MTNNPKVSVIIATHNDVEQIGNCVDMIWSRSFADVEVIVVDVNSTDGTKELLAEMASEDENITYLSDGMGSMGHARNMGMNHARAPYIMFLEPEDVLHKDALEYMANALDDDPDKDMFTCETDSFGDDSYGRTIKDRRNAISNANDRDGREQEMFSRIMRSWMFDNITLYRVEYLRRNRIRHFDQPGYGRQDSAFHFLAMAKGISCASVVVLGSRGMDIPTQKISDARAVKDMGTEFQYLKEKLQEDGKLWQRMRLVFWQAYYNRSMMLYERLSDELKVLLSKRMQADIRDALRRKEYSREHFDITVREEMLLLLKDTKEFDRYQQGKIRKRELERDKAIAREERQDKIFFTNSRDEDNEPLADRAKETENKRKSFRIDRKSLMEEMARDLAPLRMLMGLSVEEMCSLLGLSAGVYRSMESGKRELSWDQFMAVLFVFRHNERMAPVIDSLGLYPEALDTRIKKGMVS